MGIIGEISEYVCEINDHLLEGKTKDKIHNTNRPDYYADEYVTLYVGPLNILESIILASTFL